MTFAECIPALLEGQRIKRKVDRDIIQWTKRVRFSEESELKEQTNLSVVCIHPNGTWGSGLTMEDLRATDWEVGY